MSIKGEKGQGGNLIPVDEKGSNLPTPLRIVAWILTVVFVLAVVCYVLINPNDEIGVGEPFGALGRFELQTYPGQSDVLQFLGTFIGAMGVIMTLIERRATGYVPLLISIPAFAGLMVVMIGQVVQITEHENPLLLTVIGALLIYVAVIWLAVIGGSVAKRAYAWLKSCIESGC